LQDHVALRVGDDALHDPVAFLDAGVGEPVGRHAVFQRGHAMMRVPLLLGEEGAPVRHQHAEVARACLIHARVIDLVENAVANGEPDPAQRGERGADAGLVA
jgi:hypothetical protein